MQGKWRWLIYAFLAWQFARVVFAAFYVPWSWTVYQCLLVFMLLCAVSAVGFWAFLWQREGTAAVKERWALRQQRWAAPLDFKARRWNLVFWIAVAVVLVVIFNMVQR